LPTNILYAFLFSPIRATCPVYLISSSPSRVKDETSFSAWVCVMILRFWYTSVITERIRSCGICGGQNKTFFPSTFISPTSSHSTNW
jgi:hypothetical protein